MKEGEEEEEEEETIYSLIERTGGYPVHGVHRGGGGNFGPESTMYSFEKCLSFGVRLLELDVRRTKDKELVIMHDYCVERTTDGSGPLSQYTLKEVKQLDAAYHYPQLRGQGIRVPTLREFLDRFSLSPNLLFFFDFKDTKTIISSLEMIQSYPALVNRYMLGSVFTDCNLLLRKLRVSPSIPVITDRDSTFSLVTSYGLGSLQRKEMKQDIFGYVLEPRTESFFSRGLVEALHKKNKRVLVCGENLSTERDLKLCCEIGVDFILTDRPDLFCTILKEREGEK